MWTGASQDFREKSIDGITPQNVIVAFDRLYFSGNDGDFTDSGVIFNDYFNTGDDLSFGEVPSATLSFSVLNDNGGLSSFQYGDAQAYFGLKMDAEAFTMPAGCNCYIEYDSHVYTGKADGLYIDGSRSAAISVGVTGLLGYGGKIYAVGEGASVVLDLASSTASSYTPNRFMVEKFRYGKSVVFEDYSATVWTPTESETWEYVPMGVYQVKRPEQNLAKVVKIVDAHDYMTKFDADATEFIGGLTYPTTIGDIYTDLCDFVGVDYESGTFTGSDVILDASPFPDTTTTLRTLLKWIAERAFSIARFDREGVLKLHWISSSLVDEITEHNVVWDRATVSEYIVSKVTGAILKDASGNTLQFGSMDNPYVIAGNPFFNTLTSEDLNTITGLALYVPLTVGIIYPDPTVDVGDVLSIQVEPSTSNVFIDAYNRVYANEDQEAFTTTVAPYVIPLMERRLLWNGWLSGTYTTRGNRARIYDLDNTEYNASISIKEKVEKVMTPEEVFNKLTDNGRIQGLYMVDGQIFVNAEYIKSGKISAIDIEGVTISGSTFAAGRVITLDPVDYSQADIDRITQIILGNVIPTEEDYEHLDVNKDGVINIIDTSYIANMLLYGNKIVIDARAKIDGDALTSEIIKIGNYTKIGYRALQSEQLIAKSSVNSEGLVTAKTGLNVGETTDDTWASIPGGSGQIIFSAGGHTLTIDSTGVKVDGRSI